MTAVRLRPVAAAAAIAAAALSTTPAAAFTWSGVVGSAAAPRRSSAIRSLPSRRRADRFPGRDERADITPAAAAAPRYTSLGTLPAALGCRRSFHAVAPRPHGTRLRAKREGGESPDGGGENESGPKAKGGGGSGGKPSKKGGGKKSPTQAKKKSRKGQGKGDGKKKRKKKKGDGGGGGGGGNILDLIDPFKAGQKVRRALDRTVETAVTTLSPQAAGKSKKSIYYLDDRLMEPGEGPAMFAERNPLFDRLSYGEDALPEVLIVGATGEVGRLVVRRLLLDGRFRVRVLVRDLYSDTLNLLGTGVTYCQGDLSDVESLEYAVTDVDKIVFCAGVPRPDEDDFRRRFREFSRENLMQHDDSGGGGSSSARTGDGDGEPPAAPSSSSAVDSIVRDRRDGDRALLLAAASAGSSGGPEDEDQSDEEWQRMRSVLEVRSRLAERIDLAGMRNLIRAYQNVRHADYGTSQAAKRSLFKFQRRPGDFDLFSIEDGDGGGEGAEEADGANVGRGATGKNRNGRKSRQGKGGGTTTTARCGWIRNKFGHGVFVGRVPSGGGAASVISGRLSSRESPDSGIDLSAGGFGGFVVRACSDGGRYEAFVRKSDYDSGDGVEYVCEFDTGTKPSGSGGGGGGGGGRSSSTNRFVTVRLPFSRFRPVRADGAAVPVSAAGSFDGSDVRRIGFRYRSNGGGNSLRDALSSAARASTSGVGRKYSKFYLALSYVKVYRTQPEPEFVYVSDARIPPVVRNGMVRHDARRIVSSAAGAEAGDKASEGAVSLFDEEEVRRVGGGGDGDRTDRSGEETYYKYRGEEVLRHSGLSYTIIRIAGYNETAASQSGPTRLQQSDEGLSAVSRADVAQVCANALLDPRARNTVSYLTKSDKGAGGSGPTFSHLLPDS